MSGGAMNMATQPSPRAGNSRETLRVSPVGGSRFLNRETDEGVGSTNSELSYSTCATAPSSGASCHLLPRWEKAARGSGNP